MHSVFENLNSFVFEVAFSKCHFNLKTFARNLFHFVNVVVAVVFRCFWSFSSASWSNCRFPSDFVDVNLAAKYSCK